MEKDRLDAAQVAARLLGDKVEIHEVTFKELRRRRGSFLLSERTISYELLLNLVDEFAEEGPDIVIPDKATCLFIIVSDKDSKAKPKFVRRETIS